MAWKKELAEKAKREALAERMGGEDKVARQRKRGKLDARVVAHDPDDDFVIEAAVNAVADYIVSFNLKDIEVGAARFGIETVRPAELMRRLNDE